MRRVLLIGNRPLPEENTKSRPAAGLRTNQFYRALSSGPYNLKLATIAMPECYSEEELEKVSTKNTDNHAVFSKNDPRLIAKIQKLHDEFEPEVIISVNTYPSYVASGLKSRALLWADLNGWIMAEAQAQAYKEDGDDYLPHYHHMEQKVLRRADKFSTVSKAQSFATLGELASIGRLNAASFTYNFVHSIPNATEWFKGERDEAGRGEQANLNLGKDVFIALWMGGYNTWADEVTLFKGVEDAMKVCKDLYFVSTGGEIKGLGNETFDRFKKMVDGSIYKERFIFLGWVESAKIPALYERADIGLNVDRMCVETLTGARNRINEMMKFGLPVVTTLGSEIAEEAGRIGAGLAVESGKHELLTEALVKMYVDRHSPQFKKYGDRGAEYVEANDYKTVLAPLLEWLANPRPAPDRGVTIKFGRGAVFGGMVFGGMKSRALWKYLRENGFKKSFAKFLQRMCG